MLGSNESKFVVRGPADGTILHTGGTNGLIDAAAEVMTADVRDLENVTIILEQVVDAGTVVLVTEKSPDGVLWQTVDASTAETDFPAGANTSVEFSLSDASGMSLPTMQVRVRASALAGGGTYRMKVTGRQKAGYR